VPQAPEQRVVGGDAPRAGQWPWMAAIYLHGNSRREYWCGGSLISRQYIMTAAHCTKDSRGKSFHPRQFSVRLGDSNLKSHDEAGHTVVRRVTEYVAHPDFEINGYYNDIALFKLDRPVDLSPYVIPVCLPEPYEAKPLDALVGRSAHVIGWGVTVYGGEESPQLRSADLPVWEQQQCDNAYFQPIREMFLCAGYADGRKDACQGDSGGPLVYEESGRYMQIGIVSFGNRCAQAGYPGVYTRITTFLPWVRQNLI